MSTERPGDALSGGGPGDEPDPSQVPGRAGAGRRAGRGRLAPGSLLVATPALVDPHFHRTVVYVVAHGADGTAGLVINRRTETAVHNVLPAWSGRVARPQAVFAGGPVQTTGAMCLGVCRQGVNPVEVAGTVPISGPVVLVDLDGEPERIGRDLTGVRIFAGHAGWSPGQLAEEIAGGAWHVLPGRPADVLAGPRVDLWFQVLRRQGFPLAWQAYVPADVHEN
ncbi:YqgE/AlgH family protein [Nakamurella endophytica]|uniref:YqgE/AlgH family protein n=1 Tax=Nakamurella endophytica TaxID=1748367 RepID=UPI001E32500A|nr:YqgE/AlgH family protein [Nakamurella endophytica]